MLATDFFHVDCAVTLQRLYCLFVMEIGSRNLLMDLGDHAADFRFLIRDRAGQFTALFDAVLAEAGIEAVMIPPRSREQTLMRNASCSPPGPKSPTGYSCSANGICGPSWTSTRPTTTGGAPIAAASSARPGPTTCPLTSPRRGSGGDPSSAASSTNTSGPTGGPATARGWPPAVRRGHGPGHRARRPVRGRPRERQPVCALGPHRRRPPAPRSGHPGARCDADTN